MLSTIVLFMSVIATVLCQDPVVTVTETDPEAIVTQYPGFTSVRNNFNNGLIQVPRDRDVTMSCYVENKQTGTLIRWQMEYADSENRRQVRAISEDTSVNDNTKYSIEKPTQFTWKLRLKSIQLTDSGNYTCFVYTTRGGNKKEANITISVLVPPSLDPIQTSSDTVAREGDTLDFMCNATGIPPPTIEWSRLGGALLPIGKEKHYETKLTLLRIKPEDRGKYRCRVGNLIDTIERTIVLDVRFAPVVTAIHPKVYQAEGFVIELQCYVEANPFPQESQMRWTKDGRSYSIDSGRYKVQAIEGAFNRLTYELIINGVKDSDYGVYECIMRNGEGENVQRKARIELIRSEAARPSLKLGRIIRGNASMVTSSLATTVFSLLLLLIITS